MEELKAKLANLEMLEKITEHAQANYEREPENKEYEETFDHAYSNEYKAFLAVAKQIVKMTRHEIDAKTAREMIRTKRSEILNLVSDSLIKGHR